MFVHPPYSRIAPWIDKAIVEAKAGARIYMLEGRTGLLMYLALNRGASAIQIQAALETKKGSFDTRMRPLRESGVIVGAYWYQVNTSLRNEQQLVLFLRALGEAHDLKGSTAHMASVPRSRATRAPSSRPRQISSEPRNGRMLVAIAGLKKSYALELHEALGNRPTERPACAGASSWPGRLENLKRGASEVLRSRSEVPVASHLRSYLRTQCIAEPRITAAVNAALARRIEDQRAGRRSDVNKFAELERTALATTAAPKGVERGGRPADGGSVSTAIGTSSGSHHRAQVGTTVSRRRSTSASAV